VVNSLGVNWSKTTNQQYQPELEGVPTNQTRFFLNFEFEIDYDLFPNTLNQATAALIRVFLDRSSREYVGGELGCRESCCFLPFAPLSGVHHDKMFADAGRNHDRLQYTVRVQCARTNRTVLCLRSRLRRCRDSMSMSERHSYTTSLRHTVTVCGRA
jgi:hypothetical protein